MLREPAALDDDWCPMTAKLPRALTALAALLLGQGVCHGQNLVPNPSFEDYSICPDSISGVQVANAIGWMSYSRTPDYLNACQGYSCHLCVPDNTFAWQMPYTGQSYMQVICYYDQEVYREMIGVQLAEPLVPGQHYYGSLRVNCAGEKPEQGTNVFASNRIGMLFTNYESGLPDGFDEWFEIRNYAQIYANDIITDTAAWVLVSGSFLADSAYRFLVIGNHFDNDHTDIVELVPNKSGHSAYFVDEVCVSPNPEGCPLATGLIDARAEGIGIWPNPACSMLNVSVEPSTRSRVVDLLGRLVFEPYGAVSGTWSADVSGWAEGIYILVVENGSDSRSMRFAVAH